MIQVKFAMTRMKIFKRFGAIQSVKPLENGRGFPSHIPTGQVVDDSRGN
jgi:hypothetical protein